jgi:hypothetical protein
MSQLIFRSGKQQLALTEYDGGWMPEAARTLWREEEFLCLQAIEPQILELPARSSG